jgi:hypothetical protein
MVCRVLQLLFMQLDCYAAFDPMMAQGPQYTALQVTH